MHLPLFSVWSHDPKDIAFDDASRVNLPNLTDVVILYDGYKNNQSTLVPSYDHNNSVSDVLVEALQQCIPNATIRKCSLFDEKSPDAAFSFLVAIKSESLDFSMALNEPSMLQSSATWMDYVKQQHGGQEGGRGDGGDVSGKLRVIRFAYTPSNNRFPLIHNVLPDFCLDSPEKLGNLVAAICGGESTSALFPDDLLQRVWGDIDGEVLNIERQIQQQQSPSPWQGDSSLGQSVNRLHQHHQQQQNPECITLAKGSG